MLELTNVTLLLLVVLMVSSGCLFLFGSKKITRYFVYVIPLILSFLIFYFIFTSYSKFGIIYVIFVVFASLSYGVISFSLYAKKNYFYFFSLLSLLFSLGLVITNRLTYAELTVNLTIFCVICGFAFDMLSKLIWRHEA